MLKTILLLAIVGASSALTTITFHDDPKMEDEGLKWRVGTCVRMNLDSVRYAEGAKLSSDSGDACVVVYDLVGCLGNRVEVTEDTVDIEQFRNARSLSPCGSYEPDPETTDEQALNQLGRFNRRSKNSDVSIYSDDKLKDANWFLTTVPRIADYIKKTYGSIGSSTNSRLLVYYLSVEGVLGTSQNTAFQDEESFRNVAKIFGGKDSLSNGNKAGKPRDHWLFDQTLNSIGCLLDHANNNVFSTVTQDVWRDCISFAHIFKYDMYLALGFKEEADRVKRELMNYKQNVPKEDTYWFRDWLLPVYERYGKAKVYDQFMKLLAQHYPKKNRNVNGKSVGREYARRMNVGEFVHFFSGAAGTNLKELATKAFGWDSDREAQFQRARREFRRIRYSG